jgi:hypothetical protein
VKVALVLAVVAVALVGLAGAWWSSGGDIGCRGRSVDEGEFVQGNEAILAELEQYPGLTLVNSYSSGQTATDKCNPLAESGPPYGSYTTTWIYTPPPDASDTELIDFYDKQARGTWSPAIVRRKPINDCEVSYTRGPAVLYLSACSGSGTFQISIDHAALG